MKGRKPIDIIPQHIDEKLAMDLKEHLGPQSYFECLMLRVPLIPLKRNHKTQMLFLTLFFVIFFANLMIILPTLSEKLGIVT